MNNKASPTLARTPAGMPKQGGNFPKTEYPTNVKGSGVPHNDGGGKARPTIASTKMGGVGFGGFKRG